MSREADWKSYDGALMQQGNGQTIVVFHAEQKYMEHASKMQQRPVYKEIIKIKRILPGDNTYQPDEEVKEHHIEQYREQYEHFLKTRENKQLGIPIDHWHAISDTQKAEFKAMNIRTVEQFAGLSDLAGQKIMGFNSLREKAKVFVSAGRDAELIGEVRKEAAAKEAAMQAQIDELKRMFEQATKPEPKTKAS